jgi:adenine-specific DNA-methyltransferase
MPKIKDIPQIDRPRERFLKKGPDALSKSDLLAILLGSGIKGKNVQKLAQQIIQKLGKDFLNITVNDLQKISGIGQAKALQIASAISLVKRYYADKKINEIVIKNSQDVLSLTYDLRKKKKEYLVCLYLNARNALLKKEIVSVGLLDKTLLHPREIFYPATELNAAGVILVHNHPSGDFLPSGKDVQIVEKITQAGEIMGIPIIDFIIVSENGHYSFYEKLKDQNKGFDYVADGVQGTLFDLLEIEKPAYEISTEKMQETYFYIPQTKVNHFQLQNRRYIGSKYKLIEWIFSILDKECDGDSFTDIFAGTGIVSAVAAKHFKKVVLNDFLYSNYAIYQAFFSDNAWNTNKINNIILNYNNINGEDLEENYFSQNFGGKYFSINSAKIIGFIRENIEENKNKLTGREYYILLSSLLYSVDKIANTVGHYDAYFKKDFVKDTFFMRPIDPIKVKEVDIFREDANLLAKKIKTDVVYIDPPYNSRQYSRFYHVLETLTKWDKPKLLGVALKPDPENMSDYCRRSAKDKFTELVNNIKAKYLVVSYNNTYNSKSNSSKNKITLKEIKTILSQKGKTKVFEKKYRYFNAGNTNFSGHKEYLFVTDNNNYE